MFLTAVVLVSGLNSVLFRDMQTTMPAAHHGGDLILTVGTFAVLLINFVFDQAQHQPHQEGDDKNAYQCHGQVFALQSGPEVPVHHDRWDVDETSF